MTHGDEHEALLEGLALGERRADEEELLALLAGCDACRSRWVWLAPIVGSLERADRERAEVLAESGRRAAPALEARALAALEAQWRSEGLQAAPVGRSRSPWRSWMAIAAAIVAVLALWRPWSGDDAGNDRPEVRLGGEDARGFAPSEVVDRSGRFSWPEGLLGAQGGTLRVQSRRAGRWHEGPTIAVPAFATGCSAPAGALDGLEGPLRWRLEWEDASGEPRSSVWVSFSR